MDSQNKNTVFGHAASCARLNECTSTAPASSLRAQLRQSCAEINAAYRLVEARFGSEVKNKISHRAHALEKFRTELRRINGTDK